MSRFLCDSKPTTDSLIIRIATRTPRGDECQYIAQEIATAYADIWFSADQKFKYAWIATYKMIGGSEEDAARGKKFYLDSLLILSQHLKPPSNKTGWHSDLQGFVR